MKIFLLIVAYVVLGYAGLGVAEGWMGETLCDNDGEYLIAVIFWPAIALIVLLSIIGNLLLKLGTCLGKGLKNLFKKGKTNMNRYLKGETK